MKWQESTLCKLKYRLLLYQEGYHMDFQHSLNAQHSLKTQVR
jgi:hypothetical protein